jgi:hypothetical protein
MKASVSQIQLVLRGVVLAGILGCPALSPAAAYLFEFGNVFSGISTPPAGAGPWISASIQDVTPGTVQLTITDTGLVTDEFASALYFNLNPNFDPSNLAFSLVGSSSGFAIPTINHQSADSYKADGDGKYDVRFNFATALGSTFTVGDFITYQIAGIPGLVAADFNYLSRPAGGSGPFYSAAHVQGIAPCGGNSAWISAFQIAMIPEPGSAALLFLATCLAGVRRLTRRTNA